MVLMTLAVVAIGQERIRFSLRDGSEVTGSVLTGDPRSIVVETDSGRVSLYRNSIAETAILPIGIPDTEQAAATDLHELGIAAGRKAADDAGTTWFARTCCAGSVCWPLAAPMALSQAWRSQASVPPRLVAGLSGDYAAGFSAGYARRATEKQRIQSFCGVVGGGVVFTVAVLVIKNQMDHMFDGLHLDL